jgi:hypothetical protein
MYKPARHIDYYGILWFVLDLIALTSFILAWYMYHDILAIIWIIICAIFAVLCIINLIKK